MACRWALASLALALLTAGSAAAATPDSAERLRAVDRLVRAAAADDEPAMWAALSRVSRRRLGPTLADFRRMWGEAPQPLVNGRHTVIAFALAGPEAAANAWSFTVRGTGSGSRSRARTSP